jgi:hypothetical protein
MCAGLLDNMSEPIDSKNDETAEQRTIAYAFNEGPVLYLNYLRVSRAADAILFDFGRAAQRPQSAGTLQRESRSDAAISGRLTSPESFVPGYPLAERDTPDLAFRLVMAPVVAQEIAIQLANHIIAIEHRASPILHEFGTLQSAPKEAKTGPTEMSFTDLAMSVPVGHDKRTILLDHIRILLPPDASGLEKDAFLAFIPPKYHSPDRSPDTVRQLQAPFDKNSPRAIGPRVVGVGGYTENPNQRSRKENFWPNERGYASGFPRVSSLHHQPTWPPGGSDFWTLYPGPDWSALTDLAFSPLTSDWTVFAENQSIDTEPILNPTFFDPFAAIAAEQSWRNKIEAEADRPIPLRLSADALGRLVQALARILDIDLHVILRIERIRARLRSRPIMVAKSENAQSQERTASLKFIVHGLEVVREHLVQLGAEVIQSIETTPRGRRTRMAHPDGLIVDYEEYSSSDSGDNPNPQWEDVFEPWRIAGATDSEMAARIQAVQTKIFVSPERLIDTLRFYKFFGDGLCLLQYDLPDRGLEFASIYSPKASFLIVAGAEAALIEERKAPTNVIVKGLEVVQEELVRLGAKVIYAVEKIPPGCRIRVAYPDGRLIDFEEYSLAACDLAAPAEYGVSKKFHQGEVDHWGKPIIPPTGRGLGDWKVKSTSKPDPDAKIPPGPSPREKARRMANANTPLASVPPPKERSIQESFPQISLAQNGLLKKSVLGLPLDAVKAPPTCGSEQEHADVVKLGVEQHIRFAQIRILVEPSAFERTIDFYQHLTAGECLFGYNDPVKELEFKCVYSPKQSFLVIAGFKAALDEIKDIRLTVVVKEIEAVHRQLISLGVEATRIEEVPLISKFNARHPDGSMVEYVEYKWGVPSVTDFRISTRDPSGMRLDWSRWMRGW